MATSSSSSGWTCKLCTYHVDSVLKFCPICDNERTPSWTCKGCSSENEEKGEKCVMCNEMNALKNGTIFICSSCKSETKLNGGEIQSKKDSLCYACSFKLQSQSKITTSLRPKLGNPTHYILITSKRFYIVNEKEELICYCVCNVEDSVTKCFKHLSVEIFSQPEWVKLCIGGPKKSLILKFIQEIRKPTVRRARVLDVIQVSKKVKHLEDILLYYREGSKFVTHNM